MTVLTRTRPARPAGVPGPTILPARPGTRPAPAGLSVVGRWVFRLAVLVALAASVFITVVPWQLQNSDVKLAYITSGSMLPWLPVGSTISYTKPADPAALQVGDVITFESLGNGTVVTHRIIEVISNENLDGVHYQTKGDNNDDPDPDLAPAANVIGLVSGPVPWWQQLAVTGQTPTGRLIVFGSLFLLIALAEGRDILRGIRRPATAEVA